MRISLGSLKNLLENNVCEIKFSRRRPIAGEPATRRMLCTNSVALLNSVNGKVLLNYKQPRRMPKFNPINKNLIITWDIFMQDFRCINMESCELIKTIPVQNGEFWKYFNESLRFMSVAEKERFMNT